MKYIVFEDQSAIIFADCYDHKNMANGRPVKSAGFCTIETYRTAFDDIRASISCYGESLTLHVTSNPYDKEILADIWR